MTKLMEATKQHLESKPGSGLGLNASIPGACLYCIRCCVCIVCIVVFVVVHTLLSGTKKLDAKKKGKGKGKNKETWV